MEIVPYAGVPSEVGIEVTMASVSNGVPEETPFRNGILKSSIDTGRYTADYL